jgi:hypothetical protein
VGGKDDDEPDTHSTIVRRGKAAFSFSQMGQFVKELEARPLERLVADLPGLLEMPDAKYGLVSMVIGKRMRQSPVERQAVEAALRALLPTASSAAKKRCEGLLKPPA